MPWFQGIEGGVHTIDGIAYFRRAERDECGTIPHYHYVEPPDAISSLVREFANGPHKHLFLPSIKPRKRLGRFVILECQWCGKEIQGPTWRLPPMPRNDGRSDGTSNGTSALDIDGKGTEDIRKWFR